MKSAFFFFNGLPPTAPPLNPSNQFSVLANLPDEEIPTVAGPSDGDPANMVFAVHSSDDDNCLQMIDSIVENYALAKIDVAQAPTVPIGTPPPS